MDNLRQSIQTLFLQQNCLPFIKQFAEGGCEHLPTREIDKKLFVRLFREGRAAYTLDQSEAAYGVLTSVWMNPDNGNPHTIRYQRSTVFNVLLQFAEHSLLIKDSTPTCRYELLHKWHDLTQQVSEDLITIPFLASRDCWESDHRTDFSWPEVLGHNNPRINHICNKDMAMLHAHLGGSSLNFELNWLSLMNNIDGWDQKFKDISLRLQPIISIRDGERYPSLYQSVIIAALIRVELFKIFNLNKSYDDIEKQKSADIERIKNKLRQTIDDKDAIYYANDLQTEIKTLKELFGKTFWGCYSDNRIMKRDLGIADYAIHRSQEQDVLTVLTGERILLYDIFRYLLLNDDEDIELLLYIYLIIKLQFRREIVQLNRHVGFANFSIYERRKCQFIRDNSLYDRFVNFLAVCPYFHQKSNRYFEGRITPKDTITKLHRSILFSDQSIELLSKEGRWPQKENWNYTLHFIKEKDKTPEDLFDVQCRHSALRKKVERQARNIYKYLNGTAHNNRIAAIDAANSEIYCRPEVFAQAFRYLEHTQGKMTDFDLVKHRHAPYELGQTFHVGEDFIDVIDGLRAVDEAIIYLGLNHGDRIGHGLVLGVDIEQYYKGRNQLVALTKQAWLDNVAWMYHECTLANCSTSILGQLKDNFVKYYRDIYMQDSPLETPATIEEYYYSWLLRGDNPRFYFYNRQEDVILSVDRWENFHLNKNRLCIDARKNAMAKDLYKRYHYDTKVKKEGSKMIEVHVTNQYVEAAIVIQQRMLDKIEHLHIGIECNPTSNYRIGEFEQYVDHPIIKFYNIGLNVRYPNHAISVSINTDDSGVFATSIEREYALVALGLESDKEIMQHNTALDIYKWLDSIREMGIEQRFAKTLT